MPVLHLKLPKAKTIEGGRRCVNSKKDCWFPVMWVDAEKTMIQDEGDELAKQKIPKCAKLAMFEVEIECIFWIREWYSNFDRVTTSLAQVLRVLGSCAVDDPAIPDK